MTPQEFIDKWSVADLTERAAAQEHFLDLCRLLDEQTPAQADPDGEWYAFEKGAMKTGGGSGWADVWKKGHFAWEYKRDRSNLDKAFEQLQRYAVALENPPLLIVADTKRFRIHTNWTNTVEEVHELELEELLDGDRRQILKNAFDNPEQLKPLKTRQDLTEEVAARFVEVARQLREDGHDAETVARFVNRLVFCMFAEDVSLLPNMMFTRMLETSLRDPERFEELSSTLFLAMRKGGPVGFERVEWFNGGLFDNDSTLPLKAEEIRQTLQVARMNWSNIDPSIMGTLFERGLDPDKRSQLGAHYTDRDKIMLIVNPVIVEPLRREWEEARSNIEKLADEREGFESEIAAIRDEAQVLLKSEPDKAKVGERQRRKNITTIRGKATRAQNTAIELRDTFLERLRNFRVLDPACGSGNFLHLSLLALKDLEHKANLDAEALGLPRHSPRVGPECLKGIEINPFAAELARVSVWIGEIQWMRANGFDASRNPILKPLETIECRDALLNADATEAEWPKVDVIVGNPPFLGGKMLITHLGEDYVGKLFETYKGVVPKEADLVTYWFAKAGQQITGSNAERVGLVSTNSIRGGANRRVLDGVQEGATIYEVWPDEPWVVDGAAVRVSLISFANPQGDMPIRLKGKLVHGIFSDLTASEAAGAVDLTLAVQLSENRNAAFMGDTKGGSFDVPGDTAQKWLEQPLNPNGRSNTEVLRPWINGMDVTRRPRDMWIIDFGWEMTEADAALYEAPFAHVEEHVLPLRRNNRRESYRNYWWRHVEPRQGMHAAILNLKRIIVTPGVAKHRLFVFVQGNILVDHAAFVIARDDDTTFGILHSRFHELWSLRMCTWLGVGNDPRYTPTTCFGTFPFPEGLTPDIPAADYAEDPRAQAIAEAAKRLNELRENWLNPEDLVERVPEVVEGYPDRIVPKDEEAAALLKKRTLTNLYNERPAWLEHAHKALDEAVAAAYGWPADLTDEVVLERLFHLNQERAKSYG